MKEEGLTILAGGKAKPLKAAKKEKTEMDEDDKAFLEKKKAGTRPGRRPQRACARCDR